MHQRINIRVPAELMHKIEAMRVARLDQPDMAAIIRELLAKAVIQSSIQSSQERAA